MNEPFVNYFRCLLSEQLIEDQSEISYEIVQDNCLKLTEQDRERVRLYYQSTRPSKVSRWDTKCEIRAVPCEATTGQVRVFNTVVQQAIATMPKAPSRKSSMEFTTKASSNMPKGPCRRATLELVPSLMVPQARENFPRKKKCVTFQDQSTSRFAAANVPCIKFSVEHSSSTVRVDKAPILPPRTSDQSILDWALALDGTDDELSLDDNDSDYSSDDWTSSSGDDTETTYSALSIGKECFSDSDDDYEEEMTSDSYADYSISARRNSNRSQKTPQWKGAAINAYDWTFAPNVILPNMQDLFREAALNQNIDINESIQKVMRTNPQA